MELFHVSLVEIDLGDGAGDLGVVSTPVSWPFVGRPLTSSSSWSRTTDIAFAFTSCADSEQPEHSTSGGRAKDFLGDTSPT